MNDTIKLHWFHSTNPEKIRLALEELGLDYTRVPVDLGKGEHRTDAFRELHPRGKVPVLEIDGITLWESGAILTYLGQREQRLWPLEKPGLAKALNLLFLESAVFQDQAGVFFMNRFILPSIGREGDPDRIAKAQKKVEPILQVLAQSLGDADYLLGEFSLVDLAYAPWLPWMDLDHIPALAAWRERLMSRDAWVRCGVVQPSD